MHVRERVCVVAFLILYICPNRLVVPILSSLLCRTVADFVCVWVPTHMPLHIFMHRHHLPYKLHLTVSHLRRPTFSRLLRSNGILFYFKVSTLRVCGSFILLFIASLRSSFRRLFLIFFSFLFIASHPSHVRRVSTILFKKCPLIRSTLRISYLKSDREKSCTHVRMPHHLLDTQKIHIIEWILCLFTCRL